MEIHQVPHSTKCAVAIKSPSHHSDSSSSQGSAKGKAAYAKINKRVGDEQRLPEQQSPTISPERGPRSFLKTSFGQRLSTQCGSLFVDSSGNKPCIQAAGCTQVGSGSRNDANPETGESLKLTGSASGRGSSGLSEVDVKGMALVANLAEVPTFQPARSPMKLWGFPPGGIPRQRAIAMVGRISFNHQVDTSKRDGSPLGNEHRAVSKSQPKLESEEATLELLEARNDMITSASERKNLNKSPSLEVKHEVDEAPEVKTVEEHINFQPPLSAAAESEAPTADFGGNNNNSNNHTGRRSLSFKNDCGFLNLLPSKRKFSLEENEASPSQKPGYVLSSSGDRNGCCLVESESAAVPRLSSNSSSGNMISRKSLLVHLSDKPKSDTVHKDRRVVPEQFNKPVVGSFMKWMIDVGKGLAKKRCFGSDPVAEAVPASSVGGVKTGAAFSSPKSMDCTEDNVGLENSDSPQLLKDRTPLQHDHHGDEMHTSGDEHAQNPRREHLQVNHEVSIKNSLRQEKNLPHEHVQLDCEVDTLGPLLNQENPLPSADRVEEEHRGESNEVGNSTQNATEGTTLSTCPQEQQKDTTTTTVNHHPQEQHQEEEENHRIEKREQEGEASASFGMWQSSSCLLGQQQISDKLYRSANKYPVVMDGSGSEGMAEFVANMATVKSWVYSTVKCREVGSSSSKPCSFCGLTGHSVVDCSETLECELKELERRAAMLEEMSSELRDLPCLRCLGMGHLGAHCRFSVTEAASRARENTEMRNWSRLAIRNGDSLGEAAKVNALAKRQSPSHKKLEESPMHKRSVQESPKDTMYRRNVEESPKDTMYRRNVGTVHKDKAASLKKKANPPQSDAMPAVPKGMLAAVESVRLSRSELWRWAESPDFNAHVRGFFLRLRFGRWEKDLGGTGYRMARIRGAIRKPGSDEKNMSVSVDLGDMECTVDSQYVSNHSFTEAELVEWWRGRWKAGKRLISEAELQAKLAQRQGW